MRTIRFLFLVGVMVATPFLFADDVIMATSEDLREFDKILSKERKAETLHSQRFDRQRGKLGDREEANKAFTKASGEPAAQEPRSNWQRARYPQSEGTQTRARRGHQGDREHEREED